MDTLSPRCAGSDVHQANVVAGLRRLDARGKRHQEVRTVATMARDLLALADWLAECGVTHVAIESTGVYGKPVFNLLAGRSEVLLVNAQPLKRVPGRQTDVRDGQWLAQLLQRRLLRASSVPPAPVRERRDRTRQRSQLVAEEAAVAHRRQPGAGGRQRLRRPPASGGRRSRPPPGGRRAGTCWGRSSLARPTPGGGPTGPASGCGPNSRSCGWRGTAG